MTGLDPLSIFPGYSVIPPNSIDPRKGDPNPADYFWFYGSGQPVGIEGIVIAAGDSFYYLLVKPVNCLTFFTCNSMGANVNGGGTLCIKDPFSGVTSTIFMTPDGRLQMGTPEKGYPSSSISYFPGSGTWQLGD
jgi:hypothetical protein